MQFLQSLEEKNKTTTHTLPPLPPSLQPPPPHPLTRPTDYLPFNGLSKSEKSRRARVNAGFSTLWTH